MKTNAAIVDLQGRRWDPFQTTDPTTGYVTFTADKGEIHIPYSTDPVSLVVQAHELAHIRYTAKLWPSSATGLARLTGLAGTNARIVGYAEDMRITALAGRLGVKTLPVYTDKLDAEVLDKWVASFVKGGVPEERVKRAVRFITEEHTAVLADIGLNLDTLHTKKAAEAYIVHCAGYLQKLLAEGKDGRPDPKPEKPQAEGEKGDKSEPTPDAGEPEGDEPEDAGDGEPEDEPSDDASDEAGDEGNSEDDGDEAVQGEAASEAGACDGGEVVDLDTVNLPDVRQAMVDSVPLPENTEKLVQDFQHLLDTTDWQEVPKMERMALVRRVAIATRRGRKLGEFGTVLGSPYDAVSPNERRPFVAKRKGAAGGLTVLIDCSGSMHISDAELEQLLSKHPQGVVVTYSTGENGAVVRVVASHGRLAAQEDFRDNMAGMNACDGPVLEWLAKQPGERVWVCDGMITKRRDAYVPYNPSSMAAWLKAHRITQHVSLTDYLRSLT